MPQPRPLPHLALAAALALTAAPGATQIPLTNPALAVETSYPDLVDMVLAAPVLAVAEIQTATLLKGGAATGVMPGMVRVYTEAQTVALIRGANGLPARITYLADVSSERPNRAPKLKKQRVILLAAPVAGRPGELRLIGPRAQLPWTADGEARVRAVLKDVLAPGAPPPITGIASAFHVPGSLPGESETQIFLRTADSRPISLNVLRRPGEQPRWAVALGEMVDNSAEPPKRDTLLWYRLACGLPRQLPAPALDQIDIPARAGARADYQLVLDGLGPCQRS